MRRIPVIVLLCALALSVACTNKKVVNPLASVGSKQPDKVLFDRAMDALKHNKFDVARLTLQTLINTYPDSEFIARAKLGVADSWYAEGGSAALAQAELEYGDFKTFFPNMPEAAEAQLKIANIHYQQMEKPDRDYTHALRAQQEYRNMIQEFPESKLVPVAQQRLREVQEVLAQREFMVGRFYYLKQSYAAGIARLQTVAEKYPLYSKADEVLYLLGQSYEGQIKAVRDKPLSEKDKGAFISAFTKGATDAYSQILTRYPLMDRADDAKARLEALHQPIPRPTKAAVAQNKAEEDSRKETSMLSHVIRGFNKHPDVAGAPHTGDPTMVDPEVVSATSVALAETNAARAAEGAAALPTADNTADTQSPGLPSTGNTGSSSGNASVEVIGNPNAPPAATDANSASADNPPAAAPPNGAAPNASAGNELTPNVTPDPNELKPNAAPESNELKPNTAADDNGATLPPPPQINEIQSGANGQPAANAAKPGDDQQLADDATISSSKHKKKKGLRKVIP